MKTFNTLAALLCSFTAMTSASTLGAHEPATIASDVPMVYLGPITPNGPDISLNGTAKTIYYQIMALNPSFNPDDFEVTRNARAAHQKRQKSGGCCNCCPAPYDQATSGAASPSAIEDGVTYLNTLPGNCGTSAGVFRSRLSCSYNSAIWMVSQVAIDTVAPCTTIATYASQIVGSCDNDGGVNGQICDDRQFCTIVTGAGC